jgi:membrane-associated phospholipid phosphatase
VALAILGLTMFEGSRVAAIRGAVDPREEDLFRAANRADDRIRLPVRVVMQAGTYGTVPASAGLVLALGRRRLAGQLAVTGTAAWLLAKAAKPMAARARPDRLLEGVSTRESIGGDLGWLSGHVAVSTALGLTLSPALPWIGRAMLAGAVVTTAFGRMYVGAHLPLDLVGGAGLGMMVAVAVRLAFERIDR